MSETSGTDDPAPARRTTRWRPGRGPAPTVASAAEFVALRTSNDRNEQLQAAHATASVEVWLEVVRDYPDMRMWVAHNKTVPIELLDLLADDEDWRVRSMVSSKRKLPAEILERMADDPHDAVRMGVATHRHTTVGVLRHLAENDPWAEIRRVAGERVAAIESSPGR